MHRNPARILATAFVLTLFAAASLPLVAGSGQAGTNNSTKKTRKGSGNSKSNLVDINSASAAELEKVRGIDDALAKKIIDGRPYRTKRDLVTRKLIPQSTYDQIKDKIIAHRAGGQTAKKNTKNGGTTAPK
jgi:competence protein ComEA